MAKGTHPPHSRDSHNPGAPFMRALARERVGYLPTGTSASPWNPPKSIPQFRRSPSHLRCGSLLCMAQSGRFGLSLRILTVLASEPESMHTSAEIAAKLSESAVMVRRCFLLLHKRDLIEQRKGPHGGARLRIPPKQIGLGDVYLATEGDWLALREPAISSLLRRVRDDGIEAMNETTLSQVLKRIRKHSGSNGSSSGKVAAQHHA